MHVFDDSWTFEGPVAGLTAAYSQCASAYGCVHYYCCSFGTYHSSIFSRFSAEEAEEGLLSLIRRERSSFIGSPSAAEEAIGGLSLACVWCGVRGGRGGGEGYRVLLSRLVEVYCSILRNTTSKYPLHTSGYE